MAVRDRGRLPEAGLRDRADAFLFHADGPGSHDNGRGLSRPEQAALLFGVPLSLRSTMILASLPLILYLLFRKPAQRVMPRVQHWLDTNAWVVNEVVLVFFICMILFT